MPWKLPWHQGHLGATAPRTKSKLEFIEIDFQNQQSGLEPTTRISVHSLKVPSSLDILDPAFLR